jgi:hypothetical protein
MSPSLKGRRILLTHLIGGEVGGEVSYNMTPLFKWTTNSEKKILGKK